MARIPPNRRYEELRQRSPEGAEREGFEANLLIVLPRHLPPRPGFRVSPSPLSWAGGMAGAAVGGMGGAILGAVLGVAGAVLLFIVLAIALALGTIAFLLSMLAWLFGNHDDSAGNIGAAGCLTLLGSIPVLYGLAWLGERMNPLPIPLGDLLAVTLARWLNINDEWMFQALRAMITITGLVGLFGGSLWGAYGGFRLGYRWPGLALLALVTITPFALRAIPSKVLNVRPAPAIPPVRSNGLKESISPSPTPSPTPAVVWVTQVRARVRQGPGTTYPILRVLNPGERVIEQERVRKGKEEWLRVRLPDGTTGWIRRDLLERP